jgi:hypothetical protein
VATAIIPEKSHDRRGGITRSRDPPGPTSLYERDERDTFVRDRAFECA